MSAALFFPFAAVVVVVVVAVVAVSMSTTQQTILVQLGDRIERTLCKLSAQIHHFGTQLFEWVRTTVAWETE